MDCLTSIGEAIRVVRILIQHFKDISPETNTNRFFLINRLKRDRVQPYPSLCEASVYPSITNLNFVSELLHYCRAAYAVYGSYEARYTLNHDPFKLPTMNSIHVRKQAARYYKHRNNRFGPTANGKRARNIFELNTFAAAMGISPLDILYFTTKARYFMPCAAVYLDHSRYEIVVAIRGSYSLADMVTDIFCLSTEYTAPPEKFELLVKASSRDKFVTDIDTETVVQQKTNVSGILTVEPRMYVRSQTLKKAQKERTSMSARRIKSSVNLEAELSYKNIIDHVTPGPPEIVEKKKKRYQMLHRKLKSKDLLIKPITEYTKYYGHAGIYAAAAYIYHDTYKVIKDGLEKYPNYYLTMTGHSLGGSVSMLMGWFWSHHIPYQRIKVIGFSSPPCGNKLLCDHLSTYGFINVCMQNDFGPRISAKGFLFAFRRLGILSEILKRRRLKKEIKDTRQQRKGGNGPSVPLSDILIAAPSHIQAGQRVIAGLDQPPLIITDSELGTPSKQVSLTASPTDAGVSTPVRNQSSRTSRVLERLPRNILTTGDYLVIGTDSQVPSQPQLRTNFKAYNPTVKATFTPHPLSTDVSEYCPTIDTTSKTVSLVNSCTPTCATTTTITIEEPSKRNFFDSDDSESLSNYSDSSIISYSSLDSSHKTDNMQLSATSTNITINESELGAWVPDSDMATSYAITNASISEPQEFVAIKDDSETVENVKKLFLGEIRRLKKMTDDELKHEYTAFIMDYVCPDEDINIYVPGIQYIIAFNYGRNVKSLKELLARQKALGVEKYATVRMFSAPPEIFNELIFDSEMFAHHLLIYQGILLLYYNMMGVYLPIPWNYTRGGPVKKYPIAFRSENQRLSKEVSREEVERAKN